MPPEAIFAYDSNSAADEEAFRTLLDETKDFLTSRDFEIVLEKSIDWALDQFVNGMKREVFGEDTPAEGDEPPTQNKLRFAALLPGVTRWSHLAVNAIPNELVEVS
jgi:peroxin-3